jgi:hypothetical protein
MIFPVEGGARTKAVWPRMDSTSPGNGSTFWGGTTGFVSSARMDAPIIAKKTQTEKLHRIIVIIAVVPG